MNLKNVKRSTMAATLSVLFVLPQMPAHVWAAGAPVQPKTMQDVGIPSDLFPIDNVINNNVTDADDSGDQDTSQTQTQTPGQKTPANQNGKNVRPRTATAVGAKPITNNVDMAPASVAPEYSCPLFDNGPNKNLIAAIDSLSKQVSAQPECKNDTAASAVDSNTKAIKDSVIAIQQMTQATDPSQVNISQIEASVTSAIQATQNLGNILNNNSFLNSNCGRQTMSSGQALLALNDIINGVAPYALMAVSLNAALLPALPYVIGGIAVTSGISIAEKMYNANTLDMSQPEHRKALIQNTCQYVKVAKKVRFMELAQSGQLNQITKELQKDVESYKSRFSKPSSQLYALLKYKDNSDKQLADKQAQLMADGGKLAEVQKEMAADNDPMWACTVAREVVNWAQDGKSFPASVVNNLSAISGVVRSDTRLQVMTVQSIHQNAMKKIVALADQASTSADAAKACAQAGTSWVNALQHALSMSAVFIDGERRAVDDELSQNADYRAWKSQYNVIKIEQVTVDRVGKALQALAQDDSIIDRSEMAQRMSTLKAGLFGSRNIKIPVLSGSPPVLAWLIYTKNMHDRSVADFLNGWNKLHEGSLTFTTTGKNPFLQLSIMGMGGVVPQQQVTQVVNNVAIADKLGNLTLDTLPLGSRQNEIACQQLESAWLSWSAALDHLGATQLFCNMIDGVLDVNMDKNIMVFCRGNVDLNGTVNTMSTINYAKSILVKNGYQSKANIISAKLKELQCPMPSVSVMNN